MSILNCRALLTSRTQEIKIYVQFIRRVLGESAQLQLPATGKLVSFDKELTHTLKAHGYLLLYNAIEATCAAAFEDIHRAVEGEFAANGTTFTIENLNLQLVRQVLSRFRASTTSNFPLAPQGTGKWLIEFWLDDHKRGVANNHNPLMSGNLDARAMRELAEKYGFAHYRKLENRWGAGTLSAKQKRNDLAHGKVSFADCGRDVSLQDLAGDAIGVVCYLRRYVGAVEQYVSDRAYALT